jgi:rhodanese-related sulfurtransferase
MDLEISPIELKSKLDNRETVTLLDVREPWEYGVSRIEGSRHIPMNEVPSRLADLDPDAHIVAVCHHGVRSLQVAAWLRQMGYERAQSMSGGIDAWAKAVDPAVPLY